MHILKKRTKNFTVFSGDDSATIPMIALGAHGLVSVCANEMPKNTSKMVDQALNGSFHFARKIHYKMLPLIEGNFIESSPAPCKYMMKEMGLLEENLRLPLVPVSDASRKKLKQILDEIFK